MDYIKLMINKDFRNNSIWNYLFTIHNDDIDKNSGENLGGFGFENFDYEWLFERMFVSNFDHSISENASTDATTSSTCDLDHSNEASWNLLSAVFSRPETKQDWRNRVYSEVEKLLDELKPVPFSIIVFLLDTYELMDFNKEILRREVRTLQETDSIRVNYWKFVDSCL